MQDLIRHCLDRLRNLIAPPGSGRHRRLGARTLIVLRTVPPDIARWCRRAPGPPPSPADELRERRRALLRALEGVYVGPHHLNGMHPGAAR
ncbi:hypothetical protein [Streptomyces sp. URMC 125]|uniref:hypothetical protein n=1 Tax=Streptomyces sp. URMC 125 TaxID=3423419 RepID=UPI003F1D181E